MGHRPWPLLSRVTSDALWLCSASPRPLPSAVLALSLAHSLALSLARSLSRARACSLSLSLSTHNNSSFFSSFFCHVLPGGLRAWSDACAFKRCCSGRQRGPHPPNDPGQQRRDRGQQLSAQRRKAQRVRRGGCDRPPGSRAGLSTRRWWRLGGWRPRPAQARTSTGA